MPVAAGEVVVVKWILPSTLRLHVWDGLGQPVRAALMPFSFLPIGSAGDFSHPLDFPVDWKAYGGLVGARGAF